MFTNLFLNRGARVTFSTFQDGLFRTSLFLKKLEALHFNIKTDLMKFTRSRFEIYATLLITVPPTKASRRAGIKNQRLQGYSAVTSFTNGFLFLEKLIRDFYVTVPKRRPGKEKVSEVPLLRVS